MKNLILTIVCVLSLYSSRAQFSQTVKEFKQPEVYVAATILSSAFVINNSLHVTSEQRSKIAITSFSTSILSSIIIKKIREGKRKRTKNNLPNRY